MVSVNAVAKNALENTLLVIKKNLIYTIISPICCYEFAQLIINLSLQEISLIML